MNEHGRIAQCGVLHRQSTGRPGPGPGDPVSIVAERLTPRGFTVRELLYRAAGFGERFRGWLRDGSTVCDETVVDGLRNAPAAPTDLVRGRYTGKTVVRRL
ncbi:hypothetical protein AB0L14_19400 [Streptomyces sp. NPDC052727]|uniref:hypothetical protein n=1 Tax=Streptomyces sp. NPDC052727 TaxID=3154854 RepID=UPI0034138012